MVKIIARKVAEAFIADNKSVDYVNNVAVIHLQGAFIAKSRGFRVAISEYFSSSPKKIKKSEN